MFPSQFADDLRCAFCGKQNAAGRWPVMGDMTPFYFQKEPGRFCVDIDCPHCKKRWYVVWDEDPGKIKPRGMLSAGGEYETAGMSSAEFNRQADQVRQMLAGQVDAKVLDQLIEDVRNQGQKRTPPWWWGVAGGITVLIILLVVGVFSALRMRRQAQENKQAQQPPAAAVAKNELPPLPRVQLRGQTTIGDSTLLPSLTAGNQTTLPLSLSFENDAVSPGSGVLTALLGNGPYARFVVPFDQSPGGNSPLPRDLPLVWPDRLLDAAQSRGQAWSRQTATGVVSTDLQGGVQFLLNEQSFIGTDLAGVQPPPDFSQRVQAAELEGQAASHAAGEVSPNGRWLIAAWTLANSPQAARVISWNLERHAANVEHICQAEKFRQAPPPDRLDETALGQACLAGEFNLSAQVLTFSADNRLALAVSDSGLATTIEVEKQQTRPAGQIPAGPVSCAALTADGDTGFVLTQSGELFVLRPGAVAGEKMSISSEPPLAAAICGERGLAATYSQQAGLRLYEISTSRVMDIPLPPATGPAAGLHFFCGGKYLALHSATRRIIVWQISQ